MEPNYICFQISILISLLSLSFAGVGNQKDDESEKRSLLELIAIIGKKKFMLVNKKMKWAEALDFCHSLNWELLSIEFKYENDVVCEYLTKKDYDFAWISAIDLFEEGVWKWLKTGWPVEFANWHTFTHNKDKNCAFLQNDGFWFATSCSFDKNYPVCVARKK